MSSTGRQGGVFVGKTLCVSPGHDKIPSQVKVMMRDSGEEGI